MCRCRTTQPHFLAEQRLAAATAAAATTALSFAFLESDLKKNVDIYNLLLFSLIITFFNWAQMTVIDCVTKWI